MSRKRERFERSDVPRENPYRNLIGLVVLLVIGAVGFFAFKFLWGRVQVESRMGDVALKEVLDEQDGPTALDGNFEYIDNPIEKILFLQVDDPDAERPRLISAQLLLMDPLGETAHLFDVPTNTLVIGEDSSYAFDEYFNSFGPEAAIPLITTSYNIYGNHVIIGTEVPWESIEALDGENPLNLVGVAGPFIESMRTDLDAGELVEHAALFKSLGVTSLEVEETPVLSNGSEEGGEGEEGGESASQSPTVSVDLVPFGIQGGILIPYE